MICESAVGIHMMDVVSKLQAQAHSVEEPVVDATAEVEEVCGSNGEIPGEGAHVSTLNKGDDLRFAEGV